jgi:hypothetical protein
VLTAESGTTRGTAVPLSTEAGLAIEQHQVDRLPRRLCQPFQDRAGFGADLERIERDMPELRQPQPEHVLPPHRAPLGEAVSGQDRQESMGRARMESNPASHFPEAELPAGRPEVEQDPERLLDRLDGRRRARTGGRPGLETPRHECRP